MDFAKRVRKPAYPKLPFIDDLVELCSQLHAVVEGAQDAEGQQDALKATEAFLHEYGAEEAGGYR